jgi:hypothetical protein
MSGIYREIKIIKLDDKTILEDVQFSTRFVEERIGEQRNRFTTLSLKHTHFTQFVQSKQRQYNTHLNVMSCFFVVENCSLQFSKNVKLLTDNSTIIKFFVTP